MSGALLRALLRLAPSSFRARYAAELLQVHEARLGERARLARWAFSVREIAAIAFLVVRLRLGGRYVAAPPARRRESWRARRAADLRVSTRSLSRSAGFSLASITVLALGIGANTAIFSAANAFFLSPMPFADADRLVMLYETNPEFGWLDADAAPANVLDWRERVGAFSDVATYSDFIGRVPYVQDGEPVLLTVATVSGNFFDVLGVPPVVGRSLRWDETWEGADDVVVLSHALWTSMFGADPTVVGRTLVFGTTSVEVVGVMPVGFNFPGDDVQLWSPWGWAEADREAVWFRRAHFVRPIARLADGISAAAADAEFQLEVTRLQSAYPETNRVMGAGMMPLRSFLVRDARTPVLVLVGAVALLLLLACVNVANLALVRGSQRAREVALRHALGAGRARIAALLATESLLLAAAGGTLGLLLGLAGLRAVQGLTRVGIAGATNVALDYRVLLFTAAITAASGLLFALAPMLSATRANVSAQLKDGDRGGAGARSGSRATGVLVAAEVALAVLLAAGAGLMVRTSWHLRHIDPGFETDGALAVQFTVPSVRYPNRDGVLAFYDGLLESLEARPGIERAGSVAQLPLSAPSWSSQFQAEGWPESRVGLNVVHRRADAGYFDALEIPLVAGRMFGPEDRAGSPLVVLINETLAREHFPGEDPIGQRIAYDRVANANSIWYEIVGIVGDQNQVSPGAPARAEIFENRSQDWGRDNWIVVRSSGDPMGVLPTVREVLREADPLIPIAQVRPLREVWRTSMAREEFVLALLATFGALALLLAAVGVYAVTAQSARRRTREIGIRMALGAVSGDVVRLVLRQGLLAVIVGIVGGLAATLVATRALASLLQGVSPNDPWTLGSVALMLLAVGALACWVPARRATRVDPVRSLQTE